VGRSFGVSAFPNPGFNDVEIVGVARDAKYTGLRETALDTFYVPAAQMPEGTANYIVRTAGNAAPVAAAIRAAVREIDPSLPVVDLRTHVEQIDRMTAQERLFARVSGFFSFAALTLACVGLYGLMSFQVLRRTGEIGLRMALGALPAQVLKMVLRESLGLVGLGIVVGFAAAAAGSRFVASILFGLSPTDPATYGTVALLLVAVATIAAVLPARRAAKIDPMIALRAE
ncbi:MAG: FtsX-like permease family protein, partial [Opitutaceae bacterium]